MHLAPMTAQVLKLGFMLPGKLPTNASDVFLLQ